MRSLELDEVELDVGDVVGGVGGARQFLGGGLDPAGLVHREAHRPLEHLDLAARHLDRLARLQLVRCKTSRDRNGGVSP